MPRKRRIQSTKNRTQRPFSSLSAYAIILCFIGLFYLIDPLELLNRIGLAVLTLRAILETTREVQNFWVERRDADV